MDKLSVIIVAGGSGMRMQTETPKQFLEIQGEVMLFKTIRAFKGAGQIILVLPDEWIGYWGEICEKKRFEVKHDVVKGGCERFYSVKNGLEKVDSSCEFVAVHDGVRPFVTKEVIQNALNEAKIWGAAIPVVKVSDSIRMTDQKGNSVTLNRDGLRAVQTPQIFDKKIILNAYKQKFDPKFTDDASVVEENGGKVKLTAGDVNNIKITYKKDIENI